MARLVEFHRQLVNRGPQGPLEWLLFSLLVVMSGAFSLAVRLRDLLYRRRVLPVYQAGLPVISVGNLTAGGTGKTPFVDYLLCWFEQHDVRAAVVSRGYGGRFSGRLATVSAGDGPVLPPDVCGDEPYLLALKHPRSRVYIAPRRRDALEFLSREQKVDLVILDDAFQHRQVARDLDIVLLDGGRPFGNGRLLPAGLLREPPSALQRADLLIFTRAERDRNHPPVQTDQPVCRCTHRLADEVSTLDDRPVPVRELIGQQGVAFAGIAAPEQFFAMLTAAGLTLMTTHAFADHCRYDQARVDLLGCAAGAADYFVTTEKDAVKLSGLNFEKPCYVTRLQLEFLEEDALAVSLQGILDRIGYAE